MLLIGLSSLSVLGELCVPCETAWNKVWPPNDKIDIADGIINPARRQEIIYIFMETFGSFFDELNKVKYI